MCPSIEERITDRKVSIRIWSLAGEEPALLHETKTESTAFEIEPRKSKRITPHVLTDRFKRRFDLYAMLCSAAPHQQNGRPLCKGMWHRLIASLTWTVDLLYVPSVLVMVAVVTALSRWCASAKEYVGPSKNRVGELYDLYSVSSLLIPISLSQ